MSWRPTASLPTLVARSEMLRDLRCFFDQQEFKEVQTPALGRDTVVDRHLDPIEVAADSLQCPSTGGGSTDRQGSETYYLQTSPEFAMKRVLAAGMQAIYQIGPAFRAAERGRLHNPEFTMVEWYRVGDDLKQGAKLLSNLVESVTDFSTAELVTYQTVFQKHVGCDPLTTSVAKLAAVGSTHLAVAASWSSDKDDWLNLLFAELVQPKLGRARPAIVTNYPASQSALARLSEHLPSTAERFELFIRGVEIANGYNELTDASELEQRNALVNRQRAADGKQHLPEKSELLKAMRSGLPACSGCALGLDRLLLVHLGLQTIDQVMTFPIECS